MVTITPTMATMMATTMAWSAMWTLTAATPLHATAATAGTLVLGPVAIMQTAR